MSGDDTSPASRPSPLDLTLAVAHARALRAAGEPRRAAAVLDAAFGGEGRGSERARRDALVLRAQLALELRGAGRA
ncbi:hypothetical protein [Cellulomonas sp. PhB143]|uniref:hypothetical protein n=1 Tax=Cellulomonas sp. PhB143 TaxID=2485186 RepID=UPI000F49CD67|nr:hypothetical protein [Cellulomonas sp. PhB143]ROS76887.1 hypothetical protein EDF32_0872 [Cellulomonas sp. PhB143]